MELEKLLEHHNIAKTDFEATGLDWGVIQDICRDHESRSSERQRVGKTVADTLLDVSSVHSVRVRVKSPDHLAAKIIRKTLGDKARVFTLESYNAEITDLIGVRALHLFKDDWRLIHNYVEQAWELHERPKAYYRLGDSAEVINSFREAGCSAEEHPFGYRSVHYLIKSQPGKTLHIVELQVRTIFEEGWSEIDHRVRYPRQSSDQNLISLLNIFNQLAGSADEMGTFTARLSSYVNSQTRKEAEQQSLLAQKEAELAEAFSKLEIQVADKKKIEELQREVAALRRPLQLGSVGGVAVGGEGFHFLNVGSLPKLSFSKTCSVCGKSYISSGVADVISYCPGCGGNVGFNYIGEVR